MSDVRRGIIQLMSGTLLLAAGVAGCAGVARHSRPAVTAATVASLTAGVMAWAYRPAHPTVGDSFQRHPSPNPIASGIADLPVSREATTERLRPAIDFQPAARASLGDDSHVPEDAELFDFI